MFKRAQCRLHSLVPRAGSWYGVQQDDLGIMSLKYIQMYPEEQLLDDMAH
jgi:hypothetical protein